MAAELRRPPTRTASGSRPSTSRFQEGSMNDRASAAPPAQFMGPEQLQDYEEQFYRQPASALTSVSVSLQEEARRLPRPFSAAAQLQDVPIPSIVQHDAARETRYSHAHPQPHPLSQQHTQQQQQEEQEHRAVLHKKSTGFFGRVRDALFSRGGGGQHNQGQNQGQVQHAKEVRRKHSSLQEPLHHNHPQNSSHLHGHLHAPPPPQQQQQQRPGYLLHAGRTQSELNVAQILPNTSTGLSAGVGADRPSREDVMASYNQLVASGFFQSHAIQSTRHAAPGTSTRPGATEGRQTPVVNTEEQRGSGPCFQERVSSLHAGTTRPGRVSPMPAVTMPMAKSVVSPSPSPAPQVQESRSSRDYTTVQAQTQAQAQQAQPRSSLSSLFRPSIPDLATKDSRTVLLRGRKRARGPDGDDTTTPVVSPEPQQQQGGSSGSSSYFAQPLRRVAKKLREMPSASFRDNKPNTDNNNSNDKNSKPGFQNQDEINQYGAADGIVHLTPSMTVGGTIYPNDQPVRLRSPSPVVVAETSAAATTSRNDRGRGRPVVHERGNSDNITTTRATSRPRKTFSYTLTESSRGRNSSRAVEREHEYEREKERRRERERDRDYERETNRDRQRRGSSATRRHQRDESKGRSPAASPVGGGGGVKNSKNPLGQWQRVSIEDTLMNRDLQASNNSNNNHSHSHSHGTSNNTGSSTSRPLRTMASANRGSGSASTSTSSFTSSTTLSVPKAAERWHGDGKAYHLKDRGSRPDLERAAREGARGKENSSTNTNNINTKTIGSGDGVWHGHPYQYQNQNQRQGQYGGVVVDADGDIDLLNHHQQQEQWHIGNAL